MRYFKWVIDYNIKTCEYKKYIHWLPSGDGFVIPKITEFS